MNFDSSLTDSKSTNTNSNLENIKHSKSTPSDFLSKTSPVTSSSENVKNIVNLNATGTNINNVPVLDASPLNLPTKTPTPDDILFRSHAISHSNHRPHPQALRELSAIVNGMGMNNGLNVNNGINGGIGIGNSMVGNINPLDKKFIKEKTSEEYNLFNNRNFSNSNLPLNNNNNWPPLQWNNYNNQGSVSMNSTSFSIINQNINPNPNNNNLVNNTNTGIKPDSNNDNISSTKNNTNNEEKETNGSDSVATSTITTTLTTTSITTTTVGPTNNISASSTLTTTSTSLTTSPAGLNNNTTSTNTATNLHIPSLFNTNSKSFSPLVNEKNNTKVETPVLMHSDSNITLINSSNSLNGNVTMSNNITINNQTPLINQFSKLSLETSTLNKPSTSPNIYNNIFFNNDSDQNNMFHGSPVNNNSSSQILRHNSLPVSSNTSLLISTERESDISHLKNDIDLLIRSSQLKFEDLIKYKDKLSNPNLPTDALNHIKKELFIQGWYQHAYYSIRKIKDRLQDIFKLNPSVWMVDIDIYITGDIDITLYYFKLHIHTCYDLKNCIVTEWHGNRYTEISNWWASASLLFNQILLLFKLSETTMIKPLVSKVHLEDKSSMIEDEIRSSKSVDENLLSFSKKIQAIGRKGSVVNHGLNPLSSNLSNLNSSSNITSPLATSSTVIDSEEVENFNDELVLSESVLPVGLTTSSNSSIISTVPNTTPPTLSFAANGSVKFPYPGTNIYIRGLPINTTDESLYNLCIRWGKIISSKAIVDMRTNECKGFGFVMYETEDEAHTALSELNNLGYHVSFAKSLTHASQESYSSKLKNLEDLTSMNIYISNLPLDYDNDKLLELFSDFKVLSHRILKNADGTSRGVGFARFGSREIAQHVIDLFNNVTLKGAKYPLQVRFADSIAQKKLKNQVATSRKRKDSIREQHSPSFNNNYKKLDDFDATSTTKSESEFEFDRTQNSQTF